jgi:hypothetical protein
MNNITEDDIIFKPKLDLTEFVQDEKRAEEILDKLTRRQNDTKHKLKLIDPGDEQGIKKLNVQLSQQEAAIRKVSGSLSEYREQHKSLTKVGSEGLSKLTGQLNGELKAAAIGFGSAFAAMGIQQLVAGSTEAFEAQEKVLKRLKNQIVTINGESETGYERLVKQAENFQRLGAASDDEIESVQTYFAQYGLGAKEIEKVMPIVIDFAAATGQSIQQAAETVIQGANGMTRSLKPFGVVVKDTGDTSKNLESTLSQLEAKFKGSFALTMNDAGSQARKTKYSFEELQEALGAKLSPVMEQASRVARFFIDNIGILKGVLIVLLGVLAKNVIGLVAGRIAVFALAGAEIKAAFATGGLTGAMKALNIAIKENPIGFIVGGILTLIGVITTATTAYDALTQAQDANNSSLSQQEADREEFTKKLQEQSTNQLKSQIDEKKKLLDNLVALEQEARNKQQVIASTPVTDNNSNIKNLPKDVLNEQDNRKQLNEKTLLDLTSQRFKIQQDLFLMEEVLKDKVAEEIRNKKDLTAEQKKAQDDLLNKLIQQNKELQDVNYFESRRLNMSLDKLDSEEKIIALNKELLLQEKQKTFNEEQQVIAKGLYNDLIKEQFIILRSGLDSKYDLKLRVDLGDFKEKVAQKVKEASLELQKQEAEISGISEARIQAIKSYYDYQLSQEGLLVDEKILLGVKEYNEISKIRETQRKEAGELRVQNLIDEQTYQEELLRINKAKQEDILKVQIRNTETLITERQRQLRAMMDDNIKSTLQKGSTGSITDEQNKAVNAEQKAIDELLRKLGLLKAEYENTQLTGAKAFAKTAEQIQQVAEVAAQASQQFINAKQTELSTEIDAQQKRVDSAIRLADRGNVAVLEQEQKRMNAMLKKQQQYAKAQAAINIAMALSNVVVAISRAVAEGGGIGSIVTVAAALAALTGGIVAARSSVGSAGSFEKGGYTGDGDRSDVSTTLGPKSYTYHKGEFVFNKNTTGKYRDIFEDIHTGKLNPKNILTENNLLKNALKHNVVDMSYVGAGSNNEIGELKKGLQEVRDAIERIPGTSLHITKEGLYSVTNQFKTDLENKHKLSR